MSSDGMIGLSVIGIIIAIILFIVYNSRKYKVRRLLKKHTEKKIQLCKENEYVKIIGTAKAINEPLISPISKTACVYYEVNVERRKSSGEGSDYWRSIVKDKKFQNFIIEAHGEKAIVDFQDGNGNILTSICQAVRHSSGTLNNPPKFLEDYLKSHGKKSTGFFGFNKSLRYVEGIIEIGEEIAVLGKATWKKTDHEWDRYSSDTLFIYGDQRHILLVTDDPKAIKTKK